VAEPLGCQVREKGFVACVVPEPATPVCTSARRHLATLYPVAQGVNSNGNCPQIGLTTGTKLKAILNTCSALLAGANKRLID
jgi:hypothetical protein